MSLLDQFNARIAGHYPAYLGIVFTHADAAAVNKLIELLEDHDDVKEVYSNAEFPGG